jgi:hypothetical protein
MGLMSWWNTTTTYVWMYVCMHVRTYVCHALLYLYKQQISIPIYYSHSLHIIVGVDCYTNTTVLETNAICQLSVCVYRLCCKPSWHTLAYS